jgi:hypothetical protein
MGWFGAFRRSELVALTVADAKKEREGLVVAVRHQSDQDPRPRARTEATGAGTPGAAWARVGSYRRATLSSLRVLVGGSSLAARWGVKQGYRGIAWFHGLDSGPRIV